MWDFEKPWAVRPRLFVLTAYSSFSLFKGSRKNNFTFWHLIFRPFLADFEEQKS